MLETQQSQNGDSKGCEGSRDVSWGGGPKHLPENREDGGCRDREQQSAKPRSGI